ncbi:MAG: hypothetical protein K0Q71_2504 [Thermomicrobiales bacterium]|jgi:hypothetical protein|nr:hypothetical protein [Thermomicrobiales bacterium]
MARQAEIDPQHELNHDAWSEAWGDPALQELGRRLVSYGMEEEQAALTVEQTWLFYSYVALPGLRERFPMGIATRSPNRLPSVFFYLTFRAPADAPDQDPLYERFRVVKESFARDFAAPLADVVRLHLEPFPIREKYIANMWLRNPTQFEFPMLTYAASHDLDYVGVFVDDLEAELRTVMDPESVPLWLETPNSLFVGRKPAEFLDDPLDRQLRGVITRAKFNLPAA